MTVDTTQPLVGTVVETGPDATEHVPGRLRRAAGASAVTVGRVTRGIATAPHEFRAWRLATEWDPIIQAAKDTGNLAVAGTAQKEKHAKHLERLARVNGWIDKAITIGVPVFFGGWFWATFVLAVNFGGAFALKRSGAMHGLHVQRLAIMTGISALLEIATIWAGVRPVPIVLGSGMWILALIVAWVVFLGALIFLKQAFWTALDLAAMVAGLVVALSVKSINPAYSWGYLVVPGTVAAVTFVGAAVWGVKATAGDGTVRDNLREGEVTTVVHDVAEVLPSTESAPAIAKALALALWGEKITDDQITKKVKTVGGGLAWDNRRVWKSVTLQLAGKTIEDVRKEESAIAGNLQLPDSQMVIDRGANQSQICMHVADVDPWPRTPSPWPGMHAPVQDVWAATELGLDLLGGTPFAMALAQSSMLIGASTGAGKTALLRLLALIVAGDPRAQLDVWHFKPKGNSALRMFEPVCETYRTGNDDDDFEAFVAFLREAKRDLRRRNLVLGSLPLADAEDVKVTRALAHRTDIDLRPRFILCDEIQEAIEDPKHGEDITRLLRHLAKQGRDAGLRLVLCTQKPDKDAIPSSIRSVLPTRIALRTEDWQTSDMIMGSSTFRANELPPVGGAAIVKLAGDGEAIQGIYRIRCHYVNAPDAAAAVDRVMTMRKAVGTMPVQPEAPAVPAVLVEVHRLLSEPARAGRAPSAEVASAMEAKGMIVVTDADRADHAKTDDQLRQEKLADLLRPHRVRTRPDASDGNRAAYWLQREHRDFGEVGVTAALERAKAGDSGEPSAIDYTGLRRGVRDPLRKLHVV